MIHMVDEFILYDDMQYTRRDWRNRNLIKTKDGLKWLTIPVEVKGKFEQKIKDTRITGGSWAKDHWKTIFHNYSAARHFAQFRPVFEKAYQECEGEESLSRVNHKFLVLVCGLLGIQTKITWSMDYQLVEGKTERLVGLCKSAGADSYLRGPQPRITLNQSSSRRLASNLNIWIIPVIPPTPNCSALLSTAFPSWI